MTEKTKVTEKLNRAISRNERKLTRFLQLLVRVPTVNPPGENYRECVDIFEDKLKFLGLETRTETVPASVVRRVVPEYADYPRYNLLARWHVGSPVTVHFNGHYDVVPVSGKWRYGPFEPRIEKGWLYGRGSSDMKGPNAALCFALQALVDCRLEPKVNVEVSFTADEETGGELGAGYLVHNGLVHADYAVVLEGGGARRVGVGHNGVLWTEVCVKGKAAHASRPHLGVNAFEKMAALTGELQKLGPKLARRTATLDSGQEMQPTMNLGGVFGSGPGAKINTVPAQATFSIDRRLVLGEKVKLAEQELHAAVKAAQKKIDGLAVTMNRRLGIEPCWNDLAGELQRGFAGAAASVLRGRIQFSSTTGFTDMHYFCVDGGIPAVGYGAGGRNAHGVDERVRISNLLKAARVYAHFLTHWDGAAGGH